MRILVDAMGGDLAPDEIVKGAVHAQQELGAEITVIGEFQSYEENGMTWYHLVNARLA